jgi:hypothetical protein
MGTTSQHPPEGYYLLGVLPADADIEVDGCPGFDECRVRLVRAANLSALVARVSLVEFPGPGTPPDLDPERLTSLVRDHDAVLREVASSGRALVPVPFGTVAQNLDRLRRRIEQRVVVLHDALARVEGCDEWGVHVSAPRAAAQRAVRAMAHQVHERLAAMADDAVIEPVEARVGEERPSVLSAAFLINRDRLRHFRGTVEDLQRYWEIAGGTVRVSGPWPAYHFARVDLGAEGSPGAAVLLGPLSAPDRAWAT